MVREQFALAGQTHGVNAVRLEGVNSEVGRCRHNHERQEELVATCELGNEEDTGEGSMEHAAHEARHAQQGVVRFGHRCHVGQETVPKPREHKARDAAQK